MSKKHPEDGKMNETHQPTIPEEREKTWPPPDHEEEHPIEPLPEDIDPEPWKWDDEPKPLITR